MIGFLGSGVDLSGIDRRTADHLTVVAALGSKDISDEARLKAEDRLLMLVTTTETITSFLDIINLCLLYELINKSSALAKVEAKLKGVKNEEKKSQRLLLEKIITLTTDKDKISSANVRLEELSANKPYSSR